MGLIMEITTRTVMLNVALGFVPDLAVAWAASNITDSGWQGFFITLLVLQCIYFFFWAKTALWSWLLFWIYRKEQMAGHIEKYFSDAKFPAPLPYTKFMDDYLSEMTGHELLDCATRIKAAFEAGTLNGYKYLGRGSLVLQLNSAAAVAMKRYARVAKPAPQRDDDDFLEKSSIVSVEMRHDDLKIVAWLAYSGFLVCITPGENKFRSGRQLSQGRAESLAQLLSQFDRKIVPNLETEEDKTARIKRHENRMKWIWDSYSAKPG
jgi:hypothetical protein